MIRTGITENPIRAEDFIAAVPSSSDGAVLLFLGVVRDHHGGRSVLGLVYEAYAEMAEETLGKIAEEAEEGFVQACMKMGWIPAG